MAQDDKKTGTDKKTPIKKGVNGDIRCSAKHCYFNRDGQLCEAASIEVGNPYATTSTETMCKTYIDRD